ncbi:cell division protein FtsQ/DivIB [Natronohydrobacter thiooxidans]|jgi:cell division protein FtsQ|uniref:cell division protein FtsQ/DivIB n=1 Tax=Natronohydrobacter thiooxidans TaxID=87172 RepID=UPI000A035805|nr:cell division protein FtsQ/DivIB [Natronohydrobacter thiooxidans]
MRPLDPDDRDAPLSALSDAQGFWDHLGAARAEEYAQEDILPISAVPRARVPAPAARGASAERFDIGDCRLGSLDHTLQARGAADAVAPDLMQADHGAVAPEQPVLPEQIAGFAAVAPPAAPRRGKARRRRFGAGRVGYRMQRIWLTPAYRAFFKYGLPALAVVSAVALYFSNPVNREALAGTIEAMYSAFVDRPEFMVTELRWHEVTPELDAALSARLDLDLPQSSFRLDLDALRAEIEALDWVRSADLRLLSDGVLTLSVIERVPAILWRNGGGLELLDTEGVRVAYVASRDMRPDLPLIAGAGANEQIREALDLLDAAAPLGERLIGLVRIGERRWDVVLDRDQRIRLPETDALAALERVIALEQAQDLLTRDLVVADLRNPARPVLQISAGAMDTLREIRMQSQESFR